MKPNHAPGMRTLHVQVSLDHLSWLTKKERLGCTGSLEVLASALLAAAIDDHREVMKEAAE
jgi:tRNA U55 pseudouridine synthase TruB